jgi:exoribonuclease-2
MNTNAQNHRLILKNIARRAMLERGLLPDFSAEALAELDHLHSPTVQEAALIPNGQTIRDLRHLLWCSIDNDDSRDIDQLTAAESMPDGRIKIYVSIADVDVCIVKESAIDQHASHNTTSVYTAAEIFPMLPEKVSTDLTSLNLDEDRLSIVIEMVFNADGSLGDSQIYQAWAHNFAKLAYNSVAAWLENTADMPGAVAAVPGLADNLRWQDQIAQRIKDYRHSHGALSLETIEARPVFEGDQILALEREEKNRAKEIIEDFMIAANGVTARYLDTKKFPSIRRMVRTPKRWERIVEIATEHNYHLPETPDAKALETFLVKQRTADPLRFPDLSLSVIKLLGAGEYIADFPNGNVPGHFGLAVKDYAHSTAPNRRFPDLVTQRLIKAALAGMPVPYSKEELDTLAAHCTRAEDDANKVERQVGKSAAALLLQSKIGEQFDSIVTGSAAKGTWVRLLHFPVEGKLVRGANGVDVGHRLRVRLVFVDVDRGYIDFEKV